MKRSRLLISPLAMRAPAYLQPKLTVNSPGDQYEQEADRVADQVMRMPGPQVQRLCPECEDKLQRQPIAEQEGKKEDETLQTKPLTESITPLIQRQTKPMEEEKKQEEEALQTKTASGEPPIVSPPLQHQIGALQGGGQPLPESERHFFEPRFGTDFSHVRIHTDGQASEAARAVKARAFTLGRNVVFGAGQYQPRSGEGKRLLAHELTHVVQQCPEDIVRCQSQRQPQQKHQDREDLILILSSDANLLAEGRTFAANNRVIRIFSVDHMIKKLKRINFPIRNLVIVAHSTSAGDLIFEGKKKNVYVSLSSLARQLTNTIPQGYVPDSIEFRGCQIGNASSAMEKIRGTLGAKAATGSSCYVIVQANGPIQIDGKNITDRSQVNQSNLARFNTYFKKLIDSFGSARNCILDQSKKAYFRSSGKLVAVWTHPHRRQTWDERSSKCYKELPVEKMTSSSAKEQSSDEDIYRLADRSCKIIRVEAIPENHKISIAQ